MPVEESGESMSSSKYGIPRWLINEVATEEEKEIIKELCFLMKCNAYSWNQREQLSQYRRLLINRYSKTFDHGIYKIRCAIRNYDDGIYFLEPCRFGLGMAEVRNHDRLKLPKKGDIVTWYGRGYEMPDHRLNYFLDSNSRIFRLMHNSILKISPIKD